VDAPILVHDENARRFGSVHHSLNGLAVLGDSRLITTAA
jgi:hypothetical protein